MTPVLVAWEFGEDLGHLRRVMPIARALRERGHAVALAFRDATQLASAADEGFAAWPAPLLKRPASFDPAPVSASDVLLNLGFADARSLAGALRGWNALLEAVDPAVVVADYAPVAMIAARQRGLRRVTVGSGFALPAPGDPTPAMRAGPRSDSDSRRRLDAALLEVIRKATGDGHAWNGVRDVFSGDVDLLTTLPEVDPFGPRDASYVGPVHAEAGGVDAAWDDVPAPRILAYLKPRDPRFASVLSALRASGAQALVAAPGLAHADSVAANTDLLRVFAQPLRLEPLLPAARLAIGHGGPGFAAAALLAGVPLALLPMHFEQELVARRLVQQGLATILDARGAEQSIAAGIGSALRDEAMRQRALAFAQAHATSPALDPVAQAVVHVERLAS